MVEGLPALAGRLDGDFQVVDRLGLPDLSDDPGLHQAFRGVPSATVLPVLAAAVAATAGMRLVNGKGGPLPNYWYHSTCGGHTADASAVFGVAATEAYGGVPCARCITSKYWQWEIEVPEKDLRRALRFGSAVVRLEVGSRSIDGRLLTFRATAAGGTVRYVPALSVRQALGANVLRSTLVPAPGATFALGTPPLPAPGASRAGAGATASASARWAPAPSRRRAGRRRGSWASTTREQGSSAPRSR